MIQLLPASFSLIMLPYISEAYKNKESQKIHGSYTAGLVIYGIWGIISALFILIIAEPLVLIILGQEYLPSVNILRICIFADVAYCFFHIMTTTLDGIHQTTKNLIIAVVQALITLALLFIFIPFYGITGAAYIDVIVSIIGVILGFIYMKRITGLKLTQNLSYVRELLTILKRGMKQAIVLTKENE